MKTFFLLLITFWLFLLSVPLVGSEKDQSQSSKPAISDQLKVFCSPDLGVLSEKWIKEFSSKNPSVQAEITSLPEKAELNSDQLAIVSEDFIARVENKSVWKMQIAVDAVVPVVSVSHPFVEELVKSGISVAGISSSIQLSGSRNWNALFPEHAAEMEILVLKQSGVNSILEKLSTQNVDQLSVTWLNTADEMMSALKQNPLALAICRPSDLVAGSTPEFVSEIRIIPIDKNLNGRIDYFEQIYADLTTFTRGVWVGKYPDELCSGIYAVSGQKPTSLSALEFLKWINTGGQQLLAQNGLAGISSAEKAINQDAMAVAPVVAQQVHQPLISRTWLIVILAFFCCFAILAGAVRYAARSGGKSLNEEIDITSAFDENSIVAPKGIYFDKTHTWAFMEQNGFVKIGIDDFIQHVTGPITRIRMKESGEKVRRGEKIMTVIRNGKHLEFFAPVSGIIREQNNSLINDPSKLNSSPYQDGWVYLIEPKNWQKEMRFMFMAGKYRDWLRDEFIRLKDFLAASMQLNNSVYAHVVLQDGGELKDHILADLGPEVWEDFQTNFINTSK